MTKPTASALEPTTNFTPLQKQWIKTLVEEAVSQASKELSAKISTEIGKISASVSAANHGDSDIAERLSALEARYIEDDKYSLSRAKLVRLMKQMGIE
jgi:hypothetical protein